jgi:hypothetical protein
MKLAIAVLATVTAILSTGLLVILFILPWTSLVPNAIHSGSVTIIVSDVLLFAILIIAMVAALAVLITLIQQSSGTMTRITTMVTATAAAAAVADTAAGIVSVAHRTRSILWLDILLIALALAYGFGRRSRP